MPGLKELGLQPNVPVLETLLARADVVKTGSTNLETTLFDLFRIPREKEKDLPSAIVCRLADSGEVDDAFWMHADPVFLKPNSDRLLLFDAEMLDICPEDAQGLVNLFNQHFAQDGWQLEAPHPDRWYLRLPAAPELITQPLTDAIGRNIDQFLPTGEAAQQWCSVLNEVQMLFHSSTVNMRREAEGKLPVNSIWFSGGGRLPEIPNASFDEVIADISLARGFARLSKIACMPLKLDALARGEEKGERLVVYHQLLRPVLDANPQGWVAEVEQFESWVGMLQKME